MVKSFSCAENGSPLITPDCVTLRELENEIERLHQELEGVRTEAKSKFARHDQLSDFSGNETVE